MRQNLSNVLTAIRVTLLGKVRQRLLPETDVLVAMATASLDNHSVRLVVHVVSQDLLVSVRINSKRCTRGHTKRYFNICFWSRFTNVMAIKKNVDLQLLKTHLIQKSIWLIEANVGSIWPCSVSILRIGLQFPKLSHLTLSFAYNPESCHGLTTTVVRYS